MNYIIYKIIKKFIKLILFKIDQLDMILFKMNIKIVIYYITYFNISLFV